MEKLPQKPLLVTELPNAGHFKIGEFKCLYGRAGGGQALMDFYDPRNNHSFSFTFRTYDHALIRVCETDGMNRLTKRDFNPDTGLVSYSEQATTDLDRKDSVEISYDEKGHEKQKKINGEEADYHEFFNQNEFMILVKQSLALHDESQSSRDFKDAKQELLNCLSKNIIIPEADIIPPNKLTS